MELKNIEKINYYYEIVKLLDKEIINLQKNCAAYNKFIHENE